MASPFYIPTPDLFGGQVKARQAAQEDFASKLSQLYAGGDATAGRALVGIAPEHAEQIRSTLEKMPGTEQEKAHARLDLLKKWHYQIAQEPDPAKRAMMYNQMLAQVKDAGGDVSGLAQQYSDEALQSQTNKLLSYAELMDAAKERRLAAGDANTPSAPRALAEAKQWVPAEDKPGFSYPVFSMSDGSLKIDKSQPIPTSSIPKKAEPKATTPAGGPELMSDETIANIGDSLIAQGYTYMPSSRGYTKTDAARINDYIAAKMKERGVTVEQAVETGQDVKSQQQVLTAFTKGPESKAVRSFNTALEHAETFLETVDALDSGDLKKFNSLSNMLGRQTGQTAPVSFEAVKRIFSDEIVKAIVGGATALGDREEAAATIDAAQSPAQLREVVKYYKELMVGQLKGLEQSYSAGTGRKDFKEKFLTPHSKKMFDVHRAPGEIPMDERKPAGGKDFTHLWGPK